MSGMFKKAVRSQAKLRCALFGPAGAGKTWTALEIATGIAERTGSRIAVIDSENYTASKYARIEGEDFGFDFDIVSIDYPSIDNYVKLMSMAAQGGYQVLIVDSLSHAWKELLEEVDKLAKAKYRGNTWAAWNEGTPKQRKIVEAIQGYPGHIIVTMRSKTEWVQEQDGQGKNKPTRVGLAPEQGKGIEYEFDTLIEMSVEHIGNVIKDRTGRFQDRIIDKPNKTFGYELYDWLNTGEPYTPPPPPPPTQHKEEEEKTPPVKAIEIRQLVNAVIDFMGINGVTLDTSDAQKFLLFAVQGLYAKKYQKNNMELNSIGTLIQKHRAVVLDRLNAAITGDEDAQKALLDGYEKYTGDTKGESTEETTGESDGEGTTD